MSYLCELYLANSFAVERWLSDYALELWELFVVYGFDGPVDGSNFFGDGGGVLIGFLHKFGLFMLGDEFSLVDFIIDDFADDVHVIDKGLVSE